MMLWLFRCLEVLCYGLVVNHFSLGLFDNVPVILLWLFTILAWDFGFLLATSLASRNAPAVGGTCGASSGEHYNLSLGVPELVVLLVNLNPVFMLLAMLGVPLQVFLAVSIIHYSWQFLTITH